MSLDGFVLSNRIISRNQDWQRALDELDFKVTLLFHDVDLKTRHGHLPAIWSGREAGFECGPTDLHELVETYDDFDFGGPWSHAYAFYWSTLPGLLGAYMGMAAYAHATEGVVFDPQEGVVLTARAAIEQTRTIERDYPRLEALINS